MIPVTRNLSVIHTAKWERRACAHDVRDFGHFGVNAAVGVEQAFTPVGFIEHRLAYLVLAAVSDKALFRAVVDTRGTERATQLCNVSPHVRTRCAVCEAATEG